MDIDANIENYTVAEILTIFNIIDPTVFNVTDVANALIAKMKAEGNADLETFFGQARDKVLEYLQEQTALPVGNETTEPIDNVWASKMLKKTNDAVNYFDADAHIVATQKIETVNCFFRL